MHNFRLKTDVNISDRKKTLKTAMKRIKIRYMYIVICLEISLYD